MAEAGRTDWQKMWGKVLAKAWLDPVFKQALIDDPKGALAKYFDLTFEQTLNVEVVESTDDRLVLPILPSPFPREFSIHDLSRPGQGVLDCPSDPPATAGDTVSTCDY